jgi:TRAP-type C4-dicarboxylate transport system substrate-binding protein
VGTLLWDQLNGQEQKWLKEAAMESLDYEKKIWLEAELHALEEIKKAGVEVIIPNKELFREEVQPMYNEFKKNPKMKKLIETIQAIK